MDDSIDDTKPFGTVKRQARNRMSRWEIESMCLYLRKQCFFDYMHIGTYTSNMHISRRAKNTVLQRLDEVPAVALIGPRQVGKTTLARQIADQQDESIYLDLERAADRNKLNDPQAFFTANPARLSCLDEIQRVPELFPELRSLIDEHDRNGQFLILGSASRDLLRQSSESLAGRIAYIELYPLDASEVETDENVPWKLWQRGGFPRSYLASSQRASFDWRQDFIRTYLERDIPQLGIGIATESLRRIWQMCAHLHGHLLNLSTLGKSLGVSHHTARSYLQVLEQTFTLRLLPPFEANLKKRMVKSPKIYVRDSGLLHALLQIPDRESLFGHPSYGVSWEGLVIENLIAAAPAWTASFYRTSNGSEIDLILSRGRELIAIEAKASTAPKVSRGFQNALDDLGIKKAYVLAPVDSDYPMDMRIEVVRLKTLMTKLQGL